MLLSEWGVWVDQRRKRVRWSDVKFFFVTRRLLVSVLCLFQPQSSNKRSREKTLNIFTSVGACKKGRGGNRFIAEALDTFYRLNKDYFEKLKDVPSSF